MITFPGAHHRVVLIAALFCFLGAGARAADTQADEPNARCTENLRTLAHALRSYVMLHDGKLPAKMSDLHREGLLPGLAVLTCPASGRRITDPDRIDAETDYELAVSIDGELPILLVREKYANHDGRALAFYSNRTVRRVQAPGRSTPTRPDRPRIPRTGPDVGRPDNPPPDRQPPGDTGSPTRANPDTPPEPALYKQGLKLYKAWKWAEAAGVLEQAIKSAPDHAPSHNVRGSTLFQIKRLKEAEQAFRAAVRLDPKNASYHGNLGVVLRKQARWPEAATAIRACIQLQPGHAVAHYELALCQEGSRNWPEMEAAARQAVKLDPKQARYHEALGKAAFSQGKWRDAEAAWSRATRLAPKEPRHHRDRGLALERLGRFGDAEKCFRDAIGLAPKVPRFQNDYGNFLFNRRRWRDASEAFRQAIVIAPKYGMYRANYAGAVLMLGDQNQARQQAQLAIRLGAKKHWVFKRLGLKP